MCLKLMAQMADPTGSLSDKSEMHLNEKEKQNNAEGAE